MIEIRHLHYIVTTAELGSFSQAALALRVKQSTLSQRIRDLELRLGTDLFDRSTRGARLTLAGTDFLSGARHIIADLDRMHRTATTHRKGSRGTLTIGISGAVPNAHSQAILLDFSQRHPDVRLSAVVNERPALARDLRRGRLDAAIVAGHVAPADATYRALGSERLFAVMKPETTTAFRRPLYWADLRELAILMPDDERGNDLFTQIASRLPHRDEGSSVIKRPLDFDALFQLIDAHSIMIIGAAIIERVPANLTALPLHDFYGVARIDYGLCWRSDVKNPALSKLIEIVETHVH